LLGRNPAADLPRPQRPRRLPRPVGEEQLMAALAAAGQPVRAFLVLAGWAGLRAKEIALLRREAVYDMAPQPVILITADATKGPAERTVPMSSFVLAELRPVLPARGWVFRRRDGRDGPNTPARVSQLANRHLHGLGYSATLHQLRHRFATQAYQADHDLRAVQELLGHRRPDTTAGYAAYDQAAAAAAVETIPVPRRLRCVESEETA
jgi:integrase